jgi:hypothetical protein
MAQGGNSRSPSLIDSALYFWLGASADAETGSSSLRSPEPLRVSAHTGNDPARVPPCHIVIDCEHDWRSWNPFGNHYASGEWCPKCGEHRP